MLYRPKMGQIKDGCMVYADGKFYLFSMYHKECSDEYRHVWLATSTDGIHFEDVGCVIEDFPDPIWAMKVYRGEDAYYMNSGSFTKEKRQTVLKFWRSEDLYHWEYRPELDVISPNDGETGARLDCMNVIKKDGLYYGYATGQYGFLTSPDGAHWTAHPTNIDYTPFPPYNPALGGFEIADCVELNGSLYLFCGGFGHLGVNGYGVYLYRSERPEGPFTPCLPYYRLNGTTKRWVNMWERCFEKEGELLAHNYIYDGNTYDRGSVYLPPIKRLICTDRGPSLAWWSGNDALIGEVILSHNRLFAESPRHDVFETEQTVCDRSSETLPLPAEGAVVDLTFTLAKNSFTHYAAGGLYLAEDESEGVAIIFDTYGKCDIAHVRNGEILSVEDTVGFGTTAPYAWEGGKAYSLRLLTRKGLYELYVDGKYLQTFNTAHEAGSLSRPFVGLSALSLRRSCTLSNIQIHRMR